MKQPLHRFAEDRRKIIGDEIARVLVAGFIMEVLYPDWLSNPVLVEKKKDDPNVAIGMDHALSRSYLTYSLIIKVPYRVMHMLLTGNWSRMLILTL